MNLDKRLLKLYGHVKGKLAFSISAGILGGLMVVGQAYVLSLIISGVFYKSISNSDLSIYLFFFFLFSLSRFALNYFSGIQNSNISEILKNKLRDIFTGSIQQGVLLQKRDRAGQVSNIIVNGISSMEAYFSKYIPQLFFSAFIPLGVLIFVFPVDLLSGFVFLLTAPLIPVFMILIGGQANKITKRQWKVLGRMSAFFLDVLQGLTTIKIFGRQSEFQRKIWEISEQFRLKTISVLKIAFLSALALELLSTLSTAVIAVEIGLRLLYGKMVFQEAIFILILAPEFYLPLRQLGTRFHAGLDGMAAAQDIFQVIEAKKPRLSERKPVEITARDQPIYFEGVSFAYNENRKSVLRNISFTALPGQNTTLIGPSGAGKTTIFRLLLKFIQQNKGKILYGDADLREINEKNWRSRLAWVPQDPYLFNLSFYENIRISNREATAQQIQYAAERANLSDFVNSLPEKYNTVIGEQGTRLSSGQARRLALARAFVRDAEIILFDEPTANLDPLNEKLILESMLSLTQNKTVITIAHRMTTVLAADKLIVLEDGKIKQTGTPDALMRQPGYLSDIIKKWDLQ